MTKRQRAAHARAAGSVTTPAKRRAARTNGKLGGRPLKLRTMTGRDGRTIEVHPQARLVGFELLRDHPLFVALTSTAAHWLRRHGFVYGAHVCKQPFPGWPDRGKTWARAHSSEGRDFPALETR